MISAFDVFRGTLPMGESFNEGLNEVPENRDRQFGGCRIQRV